MGLIGMGSDGQDMNHMVMTDDWRRSDQKHCGCGKVERRVGGLFHVFVPLSIKGMLCVALAGCNGIE